MPSLKGKKMKLDQPDLSTKGGPVTNQKKTSLGSQYKVTKFAFDTPDKAGGGWVKKG